MLQTRSAYGGWDAGLYTTIATWINLFGVACG